MRLEDQVVSLELAKKLKELGFEQQSLFYYCSALRTKDGKSNFYESMSEPMFVETAEDYDYRKDYSAFTVAELGQMLPAEAVTHDGKKRVYDLYAHKRWVDGHWLIGYRMETGGEIGRYETPFGDFEATEADARAKLLIYLKENKLI